MASVPTQQEEGSVALPSSCRIPPAPAGCTGSGVASRLLDGHAHQAAPLGPRAVVILDVLIAKQVGEHKPGVAAALANAAVGHHPPIGCDAMTLVEGAQLLRAFEGAIWRDGLAPR